MKFSAHVAMIVMLTVSAVPTSNKVGAAGMSVSDYLASVNYTNKPAWLRLVPGQRVYLPEDVHSGVAYLCDLETVKVFFRGRAGPLITDCPSQPAGTIARFVRVVKIDRPDGSNVFFYLVSALDAQWSGYASSVRPVIPTGVTYKTVSLPEALPESRLPKLYKTARGPNTGEGWDAKPVVGLTLVRALQYDSTNNTMRVTVLGGRSRGLTGWVSTDYLRTPSGDVITCFCTKG